MPLLNAKIGSDNKAIGHVMGLQGLGNRNDPA